MVVRPTEIMEPKIGMKFIMKARKPHTIGKSRPRMNDASPHNTPVAREMKNLIEM